MGSGVVNVVRGSFKGTGSSLDVRTVGFRPRSIRLYNVSGNCSAVWLDGMADGAMQKTVDSGSGTTDVAFVSATTGLTPLSDGFRLGADTDLNVSGETVHYECME